MIGSFNILSKTLSNHDVLNACVCDFFYKLCGGGIV